MDPRRDPDAFCRWCGRWTGKRDEFCCDTCRELEDMAAWEFHNKGCNDGEEYWR